MNARLIAYWQGLTNGARWILAMSGTALLLGVCFAYLWQPAVAGRRTLSTRIPVLQQSLATMQREAEEFKRINAMPAVVSNTAPRVAADPTALQGAFGATAKITVNDNRSFTISMASIAYPALLDRMDLALARFRLRVVSLSINTIGDGSSVSAELVVADDTTRPSS